MNDKLELRPLTEAELRLLAKRRLNMGFYGRGSNTDTVMEEYYQSYKGDLAHMKEAPYTDGVNIYWLTKGKPLPKEN
jgi:hypothetical protein